ncbi:MAG TPA: nitroreductase family protein [Thermoleophilia bacterium]|nr:nitroreductase family protein [Thermoleophilia bacterium]
MPRRAKTSDVMTFAEAVEGRRSVRRFSAAPVPRQDVCGIVALATRAANAGNEQMWRFIAVEDRDLLRRMGETVAAKLEELTTWPALRDETVRVRRMKGFSTFFAAAPLTIVVLGLPYVSIGDELLLKAGCTSEERDRLRARPDLQSIGAAVQLLCTAAHAMGYGTCWMTAPVIAAPELERLLCVGPPARIVALVPLGRPAGRPRGSKRLPVDDVLEFR